MTQEIKIGQKWKELDNRFIRVIEVIGFCDETGKVICKTVAPDSGKKTKASKSRFNGKHGGYSLISQE